MINKKGEMVLVWSFEDVIERAKGRGLKVPTIKQAIEILRLCDHNHDCNIGMTWDVIDFNYDTVMGEN